MKVTPLITYIATVLELILLFTLLLFAEGEHAVYHAHGWSLDPYLLARICPSKPMNSQVHPNTGHTRSIPILTERHQISIL